jgi:rhodanese-related sulfurtransferase
MTKLSKVLAGAFGSIALLGGALALYVTKTESGYSKLLDRVYESEFPDVPLIEPETLAGQMRGAHPPVLIDARTPEEFAVSHLRNAQFVDAAHFTLDDVDDIDRDRQVVVYCSIGYRSAAVVRRMRQLGFTDVRNLYGGLFLWYNQERPVFRGERPVEQIHPYDWLWGQFITRAGKTTDTAGGWVS